MIHIDSAPAATIAGFLTVAAWHLRRVRKGFPRRRADYAWAFVEGCVAYVMIVLLVGHLVFEKRYADELAVGFGESQVNLAFIGALLEALWGFWDMWNGEGVVMPDLSV